MIGRSIKYQKHIKSTNSSRKGEREMKSSTIRNRIEELDVRYKQACLEGTKAGLNTMMNTFIDDESISSDYKQKIINMIVSLLALNKNTN